MSNVTQRITPPPEELLMNSVVKRFVLPLALIGAFCLAGSEMAPAYQKKDMKPPTKAIGTFELYKDIGGAFRFRLKDDVGNILAIAPTGYEKKDECQRTIETIKMLAGGAKINDQSK